MNGEFSNQSGDVVYGSIYPINCRGSFFFFGKSMILIANLVRLNLTVPKISEMSQEHTRGGTYPFPIYRRSVKWRKAINEMGGNIPGGNFLGEFDGWEFSRWEFYREKFS